MYFILRFRNVDTRAKFIMLYDYRLFSSQLHYIWRRIVNVLFVRQYDFSRHRNVSKSSVWFELSTVPFPLPIHEVFVTRRIDFWRAGRFRSGVKLFADKTRTLNGNYNNMGKKDIFSIFKILCEGQPLKAVVLEHTPAIRKSLQNDTDLQYSGVEIEVIITDLTSVTQHFHI